MLRRMDGSPYLYALSQMPVPMVFAKHRVIRDCNQPFADLFGYAREEIIDQSFRQLYQNVSDFIAVGQLWGAHLDSGAIYADERIMRRKDGTTFWCHAYGRSGTPADPFAEAIYC